MSPQESIAHYRIVSKLGEGGMGAVYRATDTKLNRDVAIKVLPESFANDPDRLARFKREAQLLASLNHPNIAAIYGVEDRALIMELVEGEPLRGPLPVETALEYAKQIAEALEAAHEKGITHRDLKPANIMITAAGFVKLLDFGLAKTADPARASGDPEISPTITMSPTTTGMILGTAAYMAPEQARGKPVDRRADIWAFGVVLYEMLTGRRPFRGETIGDVLASVIKEEPDLAPVPLPVRRLVRACLQKYQRRRLQHIGDGRLLLGDDRDTVSRTRPLTWLVGATAAVLGAAAVWAPWRTGAPVQPPVRFQIPAPLDVQRPAGMFSLSPDGRLLAFAAGTSGSPARIWVRPLESLEMRPLPGSERPGGQAPFFWSPDSRYIIFDGGGKLKKIDVNGGAPVQTLCDLPGMALGGAWSSVILIGNASGGLLRIPPDGGPPTPVTVLDSGRKELLHAFPVFLSDRKHFLYLIGTEDPNNAGMFIGSLDTPADRQPRKRLLPGPVAATWVPGQVLFLREGVLYAQGFDESRLELVGAATRIAASVGVYLGFPYFSASRNAVLVYRPTPAEDLQLTWFDRQGRPRGAAGPPGLYNHVSVAPDGSRIIASRRDAETTVKWDLWLWDSKRGANARLTFDAGRPDHPVLSPDESLIAYSSVGRGPASITIRHLDGSSQEEVAGGPGSTWYPTCWSHDGRFLLFTSTSGVGSDIWLLPRSPAAQPVRIIGSPFNKDSAQFSHDLRWIAYTSDESGRVEIYVRPFSREAPAEPQAAKWLISTNGGAEPRWRADGRELIYVASDRKVMAVEIKAGDRFEAGIPKVLFQLPSGASFGDMTTDAQHFLFELPSSAEEQPPFNVVLNWPATLGRR